MPTSLIVVDDFFDDPLELSQQAQRTRLHGAMRTQPCRRARS